ncbi:hypothetical protein BTN50_1657 (plasmid) [Candidatus Enterovibrio altilux]|uniref:Uncharacterized protein n=1 Tax=Candidatus Enterovibrio altilux TaxID=1927128 RepID=A0A291BAS6_9GAMM|nr:hypothetical protein BTN50_1657 [Candidatus Enterovibrio luxaltus]
MTKALNKLTRLGMSNSEPCGDSLSEPKLEYKGDYREKTKDKKYSDVSVNPNFIDVVIMLSLTWCMIVVRCLNYEMGGKRN